MDRARYCFDSEVMGYHIYQDTWEARLGEVLSCHREIANAFDPFAVCMKKDGTIVGHVPRKISSICSLFLRNNGTINCEVTGRRRYSRGIPQGGLEIPCRLIFEGLEKYVNITSSKLEKVKAKNKTAKDASEEVMKEAMKVELEATSNVVDLTQQSKRPKLCGNEEASIGQEAGENGEWVRIFANTLKMTDRVQLLTGEQLTDVHINAAQKLLLYQFPTYQGLHNPLLQQCIGFWVNNYIQIWHCRQCHWITISSVGCKAGEVAVYDSLYSDLDEVTRHNLQRVFGLSNVTVHFPNVQKQEGVVDCGLFAIAFATSLAFGQDKFKFLQEKLRSHLADCFEHKYMVTFP